MRHAIVKTPINEGLPSLLRLHQSANWPREWVKRTAHIDKRSSVFPSVYVREIHCDWTQQELKQTALNIMFVFRVHRLSKVKKTNNSKSYI